MPRTSTAWRGSSDAPDPQRLCHGDRARSGALQIALLALLVSLSSGCTCLHHHDHCSYDPCYEKVTLVYELSGTFGALASTAIRRAYSISAGDEEQHGLEAPPDRLTWQSALVTIQYPHPTLGCSSARATIRLSRSPLLRTPKRPRVHAGRFVANSIQVVNPKYKAPPLIEEPAAHSTATPLAPDEIWSMDVSKSELDLLLCDLSTGGYFSQQWRPLGGSWLYIDLGGCRTQKCWTPEPRLDDFIARVFGEGTLDREPARSEPPGEEPPREEPVPGKQRIVTPPGILPDPPPPSAEAPAAPGIEPAGFEEWWEEKPSRAIPAGGEIPDEAPAGADLPLEDALRASLGRQPD